MSSGKSGQAKFINSYSIDVTGGLKPLLLLLKAAYYDPRRGFCRTKSEKQRAVSYAKIHEWAR